MIYDDFALIAACHTVKLLVWVLPNGNVARVSSAYPGSTSDKELLVATGWTDLLHPGDRVLVDKGFHIADLLPEGKKLTFGFHILFFTSYFVYSCQVISFRVKIMMGKNMVDF